MTPAPLGSAVVRQLNDQTGRVEQSRRGFTKQVTLIPVLVKAGQLLVCPSGVSAELDPVYPSWPNGRKRLRVHVSLGLHDELAHRGVAE